MEHFYWRTTSATVLRQVGDRLAQRGEVNSSRSEVAAVFTDRLPPFGRFSAAFAARRKASQENNAVPQFHFLRIWGNMNPSVLVSSALRRGGFRKAILRSDSMLNRRFQQMREQVRQRSHARFRQPEAPDLISECEAESLSWPRRAARLTRRMCEAQQPVLEKDQQIVFTRTVGKTPPIYGPVDWRMLTEGRTLHELGPISNICADWAVALSSGLLGRKQAALATRARLSHDPQAVEFLDAAVETIDAVLDLASRYADAAAAQGRTDLAEILRNVPANRPRTFHEALQAIRLLQAVVWLSGHYHVGLGRFDQYIWPYLDADLRAGRLDTSAAEELLAEFFIALNRDSDLYPGVQQGDNGQSLMLGGVTRAGARPSTR